MVMRERAEPARDLRAGPRAVRPAGRGGQRRRARGPAAAAGRRAPRTGSASPAGSSIPRTRSPPASPSTASGRSLFGTGLVETAEDFGSQGEWPSHPELLDWLAVEFVESGWDVQGPHRADRHLGDLPAGAASRRPSCASAIPKTACSPAARASGSPAEMIRDRRCFVSGLLVEQVGGPSVKPYQPPGLWEEVAYGASFTAQSYVQDQGEALYRRSLYTFWKRTAPPPAMLAFDAPTREFCTVRRARHQHAAAGARAAERRAVRRGGARPSPQRTLARGRRRPASACAAPSGASPRAARRRGARDPPGTAAASSAPPSPTTPTAAGALVGDRRVAERPRAATPPSSRPGPSSPASSSTSTRRSPRADHRGSDPRSDFDPRPHPARSSSAGPPAASARAAAGRRCSATIGAGHRAPRGTRAAPHFAPQGEARHLPLPVRRARRRSTCSTTSPQLPTPPRRGPARLGPQGPAPHRHDLRPGALPRRRRSTFGFAQHGAVRRLGQRAAAAHRRRSPTTSASCARCTPRPSTTTRRSPSSRPAPSSPAARASARGSATASAARTANLPAFVVLISHGSGTARRPAALRAALGQRLPADRAPGRAASAAAATRSSTSPTPPASTAPTARATCSTASRALNAAPARRTRRPRDRDPHRPVRDGLPHADLGARSSPTSPTSPTPPSSSTARTSASPAPSPPTACWPAASPSAACASSSSSTAAGTSTATSRPRSARQCRDTDQRLRRPRHATSSSAACSTTRSSSGAASSAAPSTARASSPTTNYGRDHHPRCFTIWMAGGGVKPGITYGADRRLRLQHRRGPRPRPRPPRHHPPPPRHRPRAPHLPLPGPRLPPHRRARRGRPGDPGLRTRHSPWAAPLFSAELPLSESLDEGPPPLAKHGTDPTPPAPGLPPPPRHGRGFAAAGLPPLKRGGFDRPHDCQNQTAPGHSRSAHQRGMGSRYIRSVLARAGPDPASAVRPAGLGAGSMERRDSLGRPDAVPALGVPQRNPDALMGTMSARPRPRRSVPPARNPAE